MRSSLAVTLLAFAVHSATPLFAQDSTKAVAHPEADVLQQWVGRWNATIESTGRDRKLVKNAAKATVKLIGSRWLVTDFEGTFLGAPFIGHEVLGYDPIARKYVLNWVDAMATGFATGEGLYDPPTKTLTLSVSGRDDSKNKMVTWRQVDVWKDADHHDWTLRVISPKDGTEQIQMTIRYSRQK